MAKATKYKTIITPAVAEVSKEIIVLDLSKEEASDLLNLVGSTPSKTGSSFDKIYLALKYEREAL